MELWRGRLNPGGLFKQERITWMLVYVPIGISADIFVLPRARASHQTPVW
jgi:hypothetical protein